MALDNCDLFLWDLRSLKVPTIHLVPCNHSWLVWSFLELLAIHFFKTFYPSPVKKNRNLLFSFFESNQFYYLFSICNDSSLNLKLRKDLNTRWNNRLRLI